MLPISLVFPLARGTDHLPEMSGLRWPQRGSDGRVGFYLAGAALTFVSIGAYETLVPLYLDRLRLGPGVIGWVLAGNLMATGLLAIPAGRVADRFGFRRTFLVGSAGLVAGGAVLAWAREPWLILAATVLRGLGFALVIVPGEPFLAAAAVGGAREALFSLHYALVVFATMLGNGVGGALPRFFGASFADAYSSSLLVAAVISGLAGLSFTRLGERGAIWRAPDGEALGLRTVIGLRAVRALVAYSLLMGFGSGLVVPFFSLFLNKRFSLDSVRVGAILSGINLATALATLVGPAITGRIGRVRGVVVTQLLSTPFLFVAAYGPNVSWAVWALFARGALTNMGRPMVSSVAMDVVPATERATVGGLQRASVYLLRGLGAATAGVLMERWGVAAPYPAYALILVLAGLLFYRAFLPLEQTRRPSYHDGDPVREPWEIDKFTNHERAGRNHVIR